MNVVGFKARASENGELHLQIQGNPYAGFNTTLKSNGTLIIEVRSVSTASQNLPTNLMSVRSIISKSDSPLIENSGENALSH